MDTSNRLAAYATGDENTAYAKGFRKFSGECGDVGCNVVRSTPRGLGWSFGMDEPVEMWRWRLESSGAYLILPRKRRGALPVR